MELVLLEDPLGDSDSGAGREFVGSGLVADHDAVLIDLDVDLGAFSLIFFSIVDEAEKRLGEIILIHPDLCVAAYDGFGDGLFRCIFDQGSYRCFYELSVGLFGSLKDRFDVLVHLRSLGEDLVSITVLLRIAVNVLQVLGIAAQDLKRCLEVMCQRIDQRILEVIVFVCPLVLDIGVDGN